jgi:exodeoxyribonuclease V alpha subunit
MSASESSPPKDEYLTGIIERITFHAEDTGYTVARMQVKGFKELLTIVGSFPSIQAGQTLQVQGSWGVVKKGWWNKRAIAKS